MLVCDRCFTREDDCEKNGYVGTLRLEAGLHEIFRCQLCDECWEELFLKVIKGFIGQAEDIKKKGG